MKRYGWAIKDKNGQILAWTFSLTKREVTLLKVLWDGWKKSGAKLTKIKLVEYND
jgi:hypothetical protein